MAARGVIPEMIKKGKGAIVNLASVAGITATSGGSAYTASKHGVIGLSKQLSVSYGQKGIKVNAICPGIIETPLSKPFLKSLEQRYKNCPAARVGQPEEIAKLALFLASDDSDFIHGTHVVIDGGLTV